MVQGFRGSLSAPTAASPSSCRGSTSRSPRGCWTARWRRSRPHGVADERDRRGLGARRLRDPHRGRAAGRQRAIRGRALPGSRDPRRNDARPAHQPGREPALAELGVQYGLPVLFGVFTCDTLEQAIARSGGNVGNNGKDRVRQAALATWASIVAARRLEMVGSAGQVALVVAASRRSADRQPADPERSNECE